MSGAIVLAARKDAGETPALQEPRADEILQERAKARSCCKKI